MALPEILLKESSDRTADNAEQDQTARTCRSLLFETLFWPQMVLSFLGPNYGMYIYSKKFSRHKINDNLPIFFCIINE